MKTNAIPDIHVTTTRKHDTQIAPQVVRQDTDTVDVLVGDKGYDGQLPPTLARHNGIRPLINHREFTQLDKAWNARVDTNRYNQRNANETVNAAHKQKFGAFIRSHVWWRQFRELVIKCVVHNIEIVLADSHKKKQISQT